MDPFDEKARPTLADILKMPEGKTHWRADEPTMVELFEQRFQEALREADQAGFRRGVERAVNIAEGACGLATSLEEESQSVDGWNRAARAIVIRIRALVPEREGKRDER